MTSQLAFVIGDAAFAPVREASFSDDGKMRWLLRERWAVGPLAVWLMLNPSWASATRNDMTILRVGFFSQAWGYAGWAVVNMYPFITPSPAECEAFCEGTSLDLQAWGKAMETNRSTILAEAQQAAIVIGAWGAADWCKTHAERITRDVLGVVPTIHCLGVNSDGSPKHPMARGRNRVPNTQRPAVWRKAA